MKNRYILLRHGETIYQTKNKGKIYPYPEKPPIPLTKKGKEQIKVATKKLKNKKIDLIYSSDFFRTRQTAEIVAKTLGLRIKLDKRLRDINSGVFQGKLVQDYRNFFSTPEQKFSKRPPKGENWRDVIKRAKDFLNSIERKHKGKTILVVSHGDPIWILACVIIGIDKEEEILKKRDEGFLPEVGKFLKINNF